MGSAFAPWETVMKRTALFALAAGLALAANAQQPDVQPATATPVEAPADASEDANDRQAQPDARSEALDRMCLTQTGSRLIRRDSEGRKCAAAVGRSYTADDLRRTGTPDIGQALQLLDPSIN